MTDFARRHFLPAGVFCRPTSVASKVVRAFSFPDGSRSSPRSLSLFLRGPSSPNRRRARSREIKIEHPRRAGAGLEILVAGIDGFENVLAVIETIVVNRADHRRRAPRRDSVYAEQPARGRVAKFDRAGEGRGGRARHRRYRCDQDRQGRGGIDIEFELPDRGQRQSRLQCRGDLMLRHHLLLSVFYCSPRLDADCGGDRRHLCAPTNNKQILWRISMNVVGNRTYAGMRHAKTISDLLILYRISVSVRRFMIDRMGCERGGKQRSPVLYQTTDI
jgi:hypothetical protein